MEKDARFRGAAQAVRQGWASLVAPNDLDAAHIKIVDTAGNKVGGSGVEGSSIDVE